MFLIRSLLHHSVLLCHLNLLPFQQAVYVHPFLLRQVLRRHPSQVLRPRRRLSQVLRLQLVSNHQYRSDRVICHRKVRIPQRLHLDNQAWILQGEICLFMNLWRGLCDRSTRIRTLCFTFSTMLIYFSFTLAYIMMMYLSFTLSSICYYRCPTPQPSSMPTQFPTRNPTVNPTSDP